MSPPVMPSGTGQPCGKPSWSSSARTSGVEVMSSAAAGVTPGPGTKVVASAGALADVSVDPFDDPSDDAVGDLVDEVAVLSLSLPHAANPAAPMTAPMSVAPMI